MADLSDWVASLNAAPDDGLLRQVFADWLDERGDTAMAEGFRALGLCRRWPVYVSARRQLEDTVVTGWRWFAAEVTVSDTEEDISAALRTMPAHLPTWWARDVRSQSQWFDSRFSAEQTAALAFAELSAGEKDAVYSLLGG